MSDITDAQDLATYNAKGVAIPASAAQQSGYAATLTITSGTAFQVSTKRAARLYVNIKTAAALAVAIGPDSSTAIVIQPSQSSALGLTSLDIPAGWYVKLTGTTSNYDVTAILV